MSLNLHKDVNNHAWAVLCDGVGKTADQFQSYHQEGGWYTSHVFCSSAMPRRSIATFDRIRIVTLCQEGLSSREVSRRLRMNQSDIVRTWGGTEIQEPPMTCVAQAAQRLLLQLMTATYEFNLGGTLKATPPCWIMLFVQPQDVVFRLKLYEIGCMLRNFAPDVHGEVHIWHLDIMQRGTDGPRNTMNGLVRISIKFYSQMSVAYASNQTIVGDVFGGSLVRLNVSDTLSSKCSKLVVPWCFGVALCGADIRNWWSWKALKRLYETGMTSSDLYCNHIDRICM